MLFSKSQILSSAAVTLVSVALSWFAYRMNVAGIIVGLLPEASGLPKQNANSVYDYYCRKTAANNPIEDSEVVIVNISDCPREWIGNVIELVDSAGAKVIGIDFSMEKPATNDSTAIIKALLKAAPKTVMALGAVGDDNSRRYVGSYFAESSGITEGLSNLYSNGRKIETNYSLDGLNFPSFPWAIARTYNPDLEEKYYRHQYVNYMDFWYDSNGVPYNIESILYGGKEYLEDFLAVVKDKIVIFGILSDREDLHPTPYGQYIPGVLVHSYSISSIIHDKCIKALPSALLWGFCALLCFLVTLVYYNIKCKRLPYISGILKALEVIVMFLVILIGQIFFKHGVFVDFVPYFVIFAFQLFFSSFIFDNYFRRLFGYDKS